MFAVLHAPRKVLIRVFVLLSVLWVAACETGLPAASGGGGQQINPGAPIPVALLVPQGSPVAGEAALARDLENAARLAVADLSGVRIDLRVYGTAGSPANARQAALRAVADGARIIVGPLHAESANAVAVAMAPRNVNVLAFSNNATIAGGNLFVLGNTFDNVANRQAHVETTGPEIWEQTDGKVDGFICAVGSGGTLAGVAEALQPKGVKIGLADPEGAGIYKIYTGDENPGNSITEGIGQGRVTANLEGFTPDFVRRVPDAEALPVVFDLLRDEGLCMGGSTGVNIVGAMALARELGPGHTVVTILCDFGTRYQSKLYNPEFLAAKGLPVPEWLDSAPRSIPGVFEEL